jgi:ATP-binding cassette subfamily D (ALD) long-chain fatty acid import protein
LIFARVLFHAKKVVVLDEPTSAISYDFEDILFETLKKRGFTLVTISNRESLIKYHDYILKLNPHPIVEDEFSSDSDNMEGEISDGVFQKVDEEYLSKFETLDSEISYLEKEMDKINAMKERRSQLVELLSGYE